MFTYLLYYIITTILHYGHSNQWQNLVFDAEERKFELLETKILNYLKLKGLEVFGVGEISADKHELAFAELVQYLDKKSFSLVMQDSFIVYLFSLYFNLVKKNSKIITFT